MHFWHPNRKLMYIGYGYRTHKDALIRAARCMECTVVGLELVQPHFYHLDTAQVLLMNKLQFIYQTLLLNASSDLLRKTLFPD